MEARPREVESITYKRSEEFSRYVASIGKYRPLITATSEYRDDDEDEDEFDSPAEDVGAEAVVSLLAPGSVELPPTIPRFFFG